jgi:hypothetical protein
MVLVCVPLAVFVIPALAGHPAIAGDNLIQNFPLRVLSGDLLRHGRLPLWNQYIWSGSPLLGGLNAGSLYPGTLLFAVLPAVGAWVANLLAAYWAGGLGMYALTRQLGVRPLAALLAAATYAYGGAMAAQMVHLPIVQGWAWVPLLVLAQFKLARAVLGVDPEGAAAPRSSPWPWVMLLAVTLGLVLLTGEPRGMAEAEVVATFVMLWLALRRYPRHVVAWRRRLLLVGYTAVAGVWGTALGAAQLLPGWTFINASQRASETYSYFGAGSLRPQWSVLLLVPDLFGGDGFLRLPTWFASYNSAEVTGYVGLIPLVAFFGLLTRSFGRRRDPRASEWWMWLALVVLGMLMAFGEFTPLGAVFGHIPFFDELRLQSRNLGIVDLALAVLLAYWIDRALQERLVDRFDWRRWVTVAPVLMAVCLCVAFLAVPTRVESAFGVAADASELGRLAPWIFAQLALAVAVAAVVLAWARLSRKIRRWALGTFVVIDLLLFTAVASTGFAPGHFTAQPLTANARLVLGGEGRFAIYDTTALHVGQLSTIGQPDLNSFTKLPSVQGYGSLTSASYQDPTGTRTLDSMNACALSRGVFDQLRLGILITLPEFLAPQLTPVGSSPAGAVPAGLHNTSCPGAPPPGTVKERPFYFGQLVALSSATLVVNSGGTTSGAPRVGIIGANGATTWPVETVSRSTGNSWTVRFASGSLAAGIDVRGPARDVTDASVVTAAGGARYALDGQLQDALGQSGWRFAGIWQGYARFERTRLRPPVWLAEEMQGASVHQESVSQDGTEVDVAHLPRGGLVIRSEAYQEGWNATAVPAGGGPARTLRVAAHGLVQAVRVPAGTWTITFSYWAPGLTTGLALSAAGIIALVAFGVVSGARHRRRARDSGGWGQK